MDRPERFSAWEELRSMVRPPVLVVLGSPGQAARLATVLGGPELTFYQMDLYQAGELQATLSHLGVQAEVKTAADIWSLPARFSAAVYLVPRAGERELRIDVVEQAFHVLRPQGKLIVCSPYESDTFFGAVVKKVFGRAHRRAASGGIMIWGRRDQERFRRRHETTFQARGPLGRSLRFLSRPGVFSYGQFDNGARALVEAMHIHDGDRVLDIGCGVGTNGVWAGMLAGPGGFVAFVDSNVRAVELAALNARGNGLVGFEAIASADVQVPGPPFDVVLANPPYYGEFAIAHRFIERSRALLRPGGRLYLVTKQAEALTPMIVETFGEAEIALRRGYQVVCAIAPGP
jgi:16S rRNA (guanine1207-N2)-methyltransferase